MTQTMFAQDSQLKQDSLSVKTTHADSIKKTSPVVKLEGDIVLEEITIEAVLEKPSVSILQKRIDPELGDLEFIDRSFDKELKKYPNTPMINDKRLFEPSKIERLQKSLKKKKEKKSNKRETNNGGSK